MPDSGEHIKNENTFSKGGKISVLWNNVVSYIQEEDTVSQKHGWWNSIALCINSKALVIIIVHTIVDSE